MASKSNFIVRGGYDGSKITKGLKSTQISLNVFQKSVASSVRGIAATLSTLAIGSYLKDSISKASEFQNALTGLHSIMSGQGKDFKVAEEFLKSYTKDGLIPLTNAARAYKNLTVRGYNDEQIQTTLENLKNSSAFGRQAALTMGEAVQSATEGLKNENSILVDNAGVTKNVSKMWEDYAKSIGKGVQSLTQQERIQAEVNGIMEETKWQTRDAAKYADSYSGRLSMLKKTLLDIKINIGNAFMSVTNAILPLIQGIANKLSAVTATFSNFMQSIFGSVSGIKTTTTQTEELASAITNVSDATTSASKAANTLGIDKLNKLGDKSSGTAGVGGGTITAETVSNPQTSKTFEGLHKSIKPFTDAMKELSDMVQWDEISKNLKEFWEAIKPYAKPFGKGLLDFIKDAGKVATDATNKLFGKDSVLSGLTDLLNKGDPKKAEDWGYGLGQLAAGFVALKLAMKGFAIAKGVSTFFGKFAGGAATAKTVAETAKATGTLATTTGGLAKVWGGLKNFLGKGIMGFGVLELGRQTIEQIKISREMEETYGDITDWAKEWDKMKEIQTITSQISLLKDSFSVMTRNVAKSIEGLKIDLSGMSEFVKSAIEEMQTRINGATFNPMKLNADIIPTYQNWKPSKNISLPKMATGGIVDRPTALIAGEAGKEAIMPLENNTGWIDSLASKLNSKSSGLSEGALYRVMSKVFRENKQDLYLGDEKLARHSEKGARILNRRYQPT